MDTASVQQRLADLLVGASVLSMKAAGPVLEVSFSGAKESKNGVAEISTDAWVVVDPSPPWEPSQIRDTEFVRARKEALGRIYDLTGFDVERVCLSDNGNLELVIGGARVAVYPSLDASAPAYIEQDYWLVTIESENGPVGYVRYDVREGFRVRGSNGRMLP